MHRTSTALTILGIAVYIGSSLLFALMPAPVTVTAAQMLPASSHMQLVMPVDIVAFSSVVPVPDLAIRILRPDDPVLRGLLLAIWVALAIHATRMGFSQLRTERAAAVKRAGRQAMFLSRTQAGPRDPHQVVASHAADHAPSELAPLTIALMGGALWPWVTIHAPTAGFLLAATTMLAAITTVVRGQRDGSKIRQSAAVGLFAGWMTVVTYAAFGSFMADQINVPPHAAAMVALLLCTGTGVFVQLQLGRGVSYSIGLIWALVGVAALTMNSDPLTAMAATLGISAMAIVLVRAAS